MGGPILAPALFQARAVNIPIKHRKPQRFGSDRTMQALLMHMEAVPTRPRSIPAAVMSLDGRYAIGERHTSGVIYTSGWLHRLNDNGSLDAGVGTAN